MAVNIYQAVKQAMQDLVAPQLESLRGEITALGANVQGLRVEMHDELKTLRSEMDGEFKSLRTEMDGEFKSLRSEVSGLRGEMHGELKGLRGELNGVRAELNGFRGEVTANLARLDERLTLAIDVRERIVALEARLPR